MCLLTIWIDSFIKCLFIFSDFFFIRAQLICNVVLSSAVQQSESVIHTHTSTLF